MARRPLVSIVLPTYNRADLLPQALASCLTQTLSDLEVIVVDDGSTDQTAEIVEETSRKDPRVRLLQRAHEGLVASLNAGFREARGRCLTWTSDDNLYDAMALEVLVRALETHPGMGFVYTDERTIDARGEILKEHRLPEPEIMAREGGIGGCFLYRREVYELLGEYSQQDALNEDDEYVMRIARTFPLLHVPQVLYSYRLHPRSLTAQHGIEAILVAAQTRARYATDPRDRKDALAWGLREAAQMALGRRRRGRAAAYALRLLRYDASGGLRLLIRAALPSALLRTASIAGRRWRRDR